MVYYLLIYIIFYKIMSYFWIMRPMREKKHDDEIFIVCYAKDILKFRRDAFIFILIMILFLYYVMMNLLLLSPVSFILLSLATIGIFIELYFLPKHKAKSFFKISDKEIVGGLIHYRWSYFTSFYVLKGEKEDYYFLKGHLFDAVFPLVIPVPKSKSKRVFNLLKKKLIYEEE